MGKSITFGIDEPVIPTFLFNLVIAVLQENRVDPHCMLKGTDLSLQSLREQQTRISFRQAATLLDNARQGSGDAALGLTLAKRETVSDWGMLGYALASCQSGEEAIRIGSRYYQASTFLTTVSDKKVGSNYHIYINPLFPVAEILPLIIEETMGGSVSIMRSAVHPDINPVEVVFSYPDPGYREKYRDFFRCPVHFGGSANYIAWSINDVQRPFPQYNPVTAELAIGLCESLMNDQHHNQRNLVNDVRCQLLNSPGSFPTMKVVAKQLGTSERTLRRALKQENTSFQKIFDEVREKLAIEYLKTPNLTLDDIAYLVGFSDAGNFHRAFKKWTGKPPSAFR